MIVKDITSIIEDFAPLSLQADFDNSGLAVGSLSNPVSSALLCVDITEPVIDEAIELGAELVISHHPLLFHPLRRVGDDTDTEKIIRKAITHNLTIYSAHTNLDSTHEGLSFFNGHMLGLKNMKILDPQSSYEGNATGYGVVGTLDQPINTIEFLENLKSLFNIKTLRHSNITKDKVSTIALSSGSGAYLITKAIEVGADIYMAADFKYNDFFTPENRIIAVDMGHFESEYSAIQLLFEVIRKKIPTFAIHKSKFSKNPVNYL